MSRDLERFLFYFLGIAWLGTWIVWWSQGGTGVYDVDKEISWKLANLAVTGPGLILLARGFDLVTPGEWMGTAAETPASSAAVLCSLILACAYCIR